MSDDWTSGLPDQAWRIYQPGSPMLRVTRQDGLSLVDINLRTGEVVIHDEARVNEAAVRFWEAVRALGQDS